MLIVSEWYGRLANNIIQLTTACHLAKKMGHAYVVFPEHPVLSGREVRILDVVAAHEPTLCSNFFFDPNFAHVSYAEMKMAFNSYIRPLMGLPDLADDSDAAFPEVVLHLRGGDTFGFRGVNPLYVPAPLDFYLRALESVKHAGLVAEDHKHPAYRKLKKDERIQDLSTGDVLADLLIMSKANRLIVGPGTFWLVAYFLSDNLDTIVWPVPPEASGDIRTPVVDLDKSVLLVPTPLPGYLKRGLWRNSFWQRRAINNYRLP